MKVLVQDTEVNVIESVDFKDLIKTNHSNAFMEGCADEPFYVCDLGDIVRKHSMWLRKLPRVEPFYAIKCNPTDLIVKLLASLKLGFDCASKGEITQAIASGVPPERIIYANPCKQSSHLNYARTHRVNLMTFDSVQELIKIKNCHPFASLIIRLFVGATKAMCPLGLKFGAKMEEVPDLLKYAKALNLKIVGVSFHVGSGCFDASAYDMAMKSAKKVFDIAEHIGYDLNILDIGGGFPGNIETPEEIEFFDNVCNTINACLDEYFPEESNVRVIAEPGRYYVSSAFHLACTVTSIKISYNDYGKIVYGYFLNDGVYGSFNCKVFDHYIGEHYLVDIEDLDDDNLTRPSIFWGPTCDNIDKILEDFEIQRLFVGQCVAFKSMGAYTMAAGSTFNGFERPYIKYYASFADWNCVCPLFEVVKISDDVVEVIVDESKKSGGSIPYVQDVADALRQMTY